MSCGDAISYSSFPAGAGEGAAEWSLHDSPRGRVRQAPLRLVRGDGQGLRHGLRRPFPLAQQEAAQGPQVVQEAAAGHHVLAQAIQFVGHELQRFHAAGRVLGPGLGDVFPDGGLGLQERLAQQVHVFQRSLETVERRRGLVDHGAPLLQGSGPLLGRPDPCTTRGSAVKPNLGRTYERAISRRSRRTTRRSSSRAKPGTFCTSRFRVGSSITVRTQPGPATALAVRGAWSMSPISPKISPGSRVLRISPPRRRVTVPLRTMNISAAGWPSTKITTPSAKGRGCSSKNASISAWRRISGILTAASRRCPRGSPRAASGPPPRTPWGAP